MDKIDMALAKMGFEPAIKTPKVLQGGQLHRCILVETPPRSLVLKELNPFVVNKDQFPDNYEQSERVASDFLSAGLKAVAAFKFGDRFVHECEGSYFLAYPYVQGEVIKASQVLLGHAGHMGAVFAQLHQQGAGLKVSEGANFDSHSQREWKEILEASSPWIDSKLASYLLKSNELYHQSIPILKNELLVSHRDLHYGNVIWKDGDAYLIDWESAGLINPYMELIGYSLEWSGILLGHVRTPIFFEIINSYLAKTAGSCLYAHAAFYGWLGHCVLAWLFFNLQRALGLISKDLSEIRRGQEILEGGLLRCLEYLLEYEGTLLLKIDTVFNR